MGGMKGRKSKRPRRRGTTLVYVRWFDSAIYQGRAFAPEELGGFCENESSGLLVSESKDEVTIALDRCLDTNDLRLVLCIPRANIRFLRKVRV